MVNDKLRKRSPLPSVRWSDMSWKRRVFYVLALPLAAACAFWRYWFPWLIALIWLYRLYHPHN